MANSATREACLGLVAAAKKEQTEQHPPRVAPHSEARTSEKVLRARPREDFPSRLVEILFPGERKFPPSPSGIQDFDDAHFVKPRDAAASTSGDAHNS